MNGITDLRLTVPGDEISLGDQIKASVTFSITGDLRNSFTEEKWTAAYNKNDVAFKLKYGVKLQSHGFRRRTLGTPIDTYRKASIFWTRNPLLVNPMKDRRIWVQVAKNFKPYIRLTEDQVRAELLDFDEVLSFPASALGSGKHKISADVHASWQKHDYTPAQSCQASSPDIELIIN